MGIVTLKYPELNAEDCYEVIIEEVVAALVDLENNIVSVLSDNYEEVNMSLDDVHSIQSEGVEITYA